MSDIIPPVPEGFAPIDTPQAGEPGVMSMDGQQPEIAPPEGFEPVEDKYGSPGQMAITALEGAAHGVAGPLATLAETKLLGVPEHEILGRQKENPITHGVGQAVGLGGSLLTGVGEGALMAKAGEGAAALAGLGEATLGAKVGSAAVRQAMEMSILEGSDEVSKMILKDPEASTQSAIANVGMAAALGGAGGAIMTGAINPLWAATAGPKIDSFLHTLKGHLDGTSKLVLPEAVESAANELGIQPSREMVSALSGDKKAVEWAQGLYRAQNPQFMEHMKALPKATREAVAQSLGAPLEEFAAFSNADAGREARDHFINEMQAKYGPIAEKLDARDKLAATIAIPDEARRDFGSKIMEKAIGEQGPGTNSEYYDIYQKYAHRVQGEDTLGGLDRIKTELFNKNSLDRNEVNAWRDIRSMITDFQENQIAKQAEQIGLDIAGVDPAAVKALQREVETSPANTKLWGRRDAVEEAEKAARAEGKQIGAGVLNDRAETNRQYAEYRKMMQELNDHTALGDFKGTGTLKTKLNQKLSPEDFLSKFSPKGNVEAIGFLEKHFPETAAIVRSNESKRFLSPHVKTELGEHVINYKTLNNALEKGMKGAPEYMKYVFPEGSIKKIEAAKVINDALAGVNGIKDSGTPGGMGKVFSHMGSGAIGALGWVMGHNPVSSALIGEVGQRLGKDAPEAIKLAMLNFMAADKPVSGAGLKASVDFIHNVIQGDKRINNGVKAIFSSGAKMIPDFRDTAAGRLKLDKLIVARQDKPNEQLQAASDGHLGHYMPNHQIAAAQGTTVALQYLQALKPKPYQASPLDREIQPTPQQEARYHRALDIAQSPEIVLQHLKDGTIQNSDVQDLSTMYPALYKSMAQKITNAMISHKASEEPIPYKTRIGISLFLGQAMDSSMTPANILAAQPKPQQPMPQQQGGTKPKPTQLKEKSTKMFQTPSQGAEADRANRD